MDTTPQPRDGQTSRKAGLIGGIVGSVGLAASIFALTATAGAAAPTLTTQATDPAPAPADDAEDVNVEELPEEWAAAEACWNDVAAKFGLDLEEDLDESAESSIDWEALEAEAEACEDLLPQEVKDQIAAEEARWEAYDTCVNEAFEAAGIDLEDGDFGDDDFDDSDFGPMVSIETGEDFSFAEFGEGDGVITITKVGDDVSVTSTGDVSIEKFDMDTVFEDGDGDVSDEGNFGDFPGDDELENALSDCDDELPEDVNFEAEILDGEIVDLHNEDDVDEDLEGESSEG